MKLLQKLLLSAVVTLSLTGPCNSMGVGPADAAAAVPGPDFFAILQEDQNVQQIIQTTLTRAAKDDPTLRQFGSTFNRLRTTCRRFRAMLNNPVIGENILAEALHNASISLDHELFKIARLGQHAWLIPLLVRAGANVNARAMLGTVLHIAVLNGHLQVVQELIYAGANINAQNAVGMTPLQTAEELGYNDIIKVLKNAQKRDCCPCCPIQ